MNDAVIQSQLTDEHGRQFVFEFLFEHLGFLCPDLRGATTHDVVSNGVRVGIGNALFQEMLRVAPDQTIAGLQEHRIREAREAAS